jgi:DNA-binding response OmpR family regulator
VVTRDAARARLGHSFRPAHNVVETHISRLRSKVDKASGELIHR